MTGSIARLTLGLTALALLATGCGGSPDTSAAPLATPSNQPIRLGTFLPISGSFSAHGLPDRAAMELAVKEINKAGGLLGRQVELDVIDGACDPQKAVAAVQKLISNKVDVTVGAECSTSLVPALPVLRAAGMPHIEPSANSTDLLKVPYDGLFLLIGTAEDEARTAVPWLPALGAKRTVVVHDGTSFPLTLARGVEAALRTSQPTVPRPFQLNQGAMTYAPLAKEIIASGADSVFYTGYYAEAGVLIKNLRASGFQGPIILGDGATDMLVRKVAGPQAMKHVYFVSPPTATSTPTAATWTKAFVESSGLQPGTYSMQAYTAVKVAAAAITKAGTTDKAAVRKAIASTTLEAPFGPVAFDARGVNSATGFQLLQIVGNGFAAVCPQSC